MPTASHPFDVTEFAQKLSVIRTACLGMIIGIPSLRIKGLYLAMATLAAHFIVEFVITKWESVTGGVNGLPIPAPTLGSFALDNDRRIFYLIYAVVVASVFFGRTSVVNAASFSGMFT